MTLSPSTTPRGAPPGGLEGGHVGGVGLGDFTGGMDLLVHDHEAAHVAGRAGGRHAYGRQDVARPVGAELVTGAHGCRETDRLVAFQGKVEEIGAFFQTIRTVGDDDAADVVHGQILPDHGRQVGTCGQG